MGAFSSSVEDTNSAEYLHTNDPNYVTTNYDTGN